MSMVQSFQLFYISEDFQNIILKKKYPKVQEPLLCGTRGQFLFFDKRLYPPKEKYQSAIFPLIPSITQLPTLSSILHPSVSFFQREKKQSYFSESRLGAHYTFHQLCQWLSLHKAGVWILFVQLPHLPCSLAFLVTMMTINIVLVVTASPYQNKTWCHQS